MLQTKSETTCWVCDKLTPKDAAIFDGYDGLHYELYLCPKCHASAIKHGGLKPDEFTPDIFKPDRGPIGRGMP